MADRPLLPLIDLRSPAILAISMEVMVEEEKEKLMGAGVVQSLAKELRLTEDHQLPTLSWYSYRCENSAHKLSFHPKAPHEDETLCWQLRITDMTSGSDNEICHVDCID
ncbi:hypothetical protein GH714_039899 [Hevea brasiliensis]|uniref:Uncharacterized protein n=1 Tax=Hevea brasiliensis TaxID=3981 RepID=A0A6A6M6R2_HEVBR|nr:hypothetical protein GH714_039899 [Hevea brasiliensis]